jgi:hypothetical protein
MDRRDFIKTGGLALGTATGLLPSTASANPAPLIFEFGPEFGRQRKLWKNANSDSDVWYLFLNGAKDPLPENVAVALNDNRDLPRVLQFHTELDGNYRDLWKPQWMEELQVVFFMENGPQRTRGDFTYNTTTAVVFKDVYVRQDKFTLWISAPGKCFPKTLS